MNQQQQQQPQSEPAPCSSSSSSRRSPSLSASGPPFPHPHLPLGPPPLPPISAAMQRRAAVELNVGGCHFTSTRETLCSEPASRLAEWFNEPERHLVTDAAGRYFIDRDGPAFGHLLNYLRDRSFQLPGDFCGRGRLRQEAAFYGLQGALAALERGLATPPSGVPASACITVGYRGTFAFGRDGLADVKFRKLTRILVAGRVSTCRQVFGDTLNESRDPDRGEDDRYTSRFFLKHSVLEQAFEMLYDAGYCLVGSCGSGTNSSTTDMKPGQDNEETKWQHYNEFVFVKA